MPVFVLSTEILSKIKGVRTWEHPERDTPDRLCNVVVLVVSAVVLNKLNFRLLLDFTEKLQR